MQYVLSLHVMDKEEEAVSIKCCFRSSRIQLVLHPAKYEIFQFGRYFVSLTGHHRGDDTTP